jgi:hypothetical protein
MRRQNILRTFLFIIFFGIGATALSGSILCDDLVRYYHNRHLLKAKPEGTNRLESLIADYDAVLEQLEKDPNLVKRIAPATLGTKPDDEEAIYPKATEEQLNAARKVLVQDSNRQVNEPMIPVWLARCSKPPQRITLFLAGTSLILISFMFFGPAKRTSQSE